MSKTNTIKYFASVRWFRQFNTRDDLNHYQDRKLLAHLAFVKNNSPYYSKIPVLSSINDLGKLPQMDKANMMRHFDELNTVGIKKKQAMKLAIESERTRNFDKTLKGVSVGLSSGTSGHRGIFIVSHQEREAWAGIVLAKLLPPRQLFRHRVAFFLRANSNLYTSVSSPLLTFEYFDIYANMEQNLERLAQYNPTIIVAPPSILGMIADRIDTKDLYLALKKVISVAEVLEPKDEKRFKKIFKQKTIYQVYQCTEGFLGYTCREGSIHLNEDMVIIEKESIGKNRFVPIITDFSRRSQPIIRYRLNDVLIESNKKCTCGSAMMVIKRIEGREDDIFIFKDSDDKEVRVFADMIARCMLYASGFEEYRVVQRDYHSIDVYLDKINLLAKTTISKEINLLAERQSFKLPHINYKPYVFDISKKLKRVERINI